MANSGSGLQKRATDIYSLLLTWMQPVPRSSSSPRLALPLILALFCAMAPCAWGAVTSDSLATALTARVTVRVRAQDGGPVEGAGVRGGGARAASDASGPARLVLSAGPHLITVVRLGYGRDTLHVRLTAATDTTLTAVMREAAIEVAPVVVSSTRTERRLEDEPERVEVLAGGEVGEEAPTRPGGGTTLGKENPRVRPPVSPPAA